jgi:hypothetical protein
MPRPLLTGWAARVAAASAAALIGVAASAGAASAQQAGGPPVSLAITSVNPAYAQPGQDVTVAGTLTNTSGAPMSGVSVQILSSNVSFTSRDEMQEYADGNFAINSPIGGAVANLSKPLAPGATTGWSVTLQPSQLPMTQFGVYPLAAQAENSSQSWPAVVNETFLPYWPGVKDQDPQKQQIAWVWPLIDQPRQGMCAGLLNNGLAASFAPGGRLDGLLSAGSAYASSAHLTWAVDPALLANATTMSTAYRAGGLAGCNVPFDRSKSEPASRAAQRWLTQLKSATAGQPMFVTPYDDADIAALTRNNLSGDLNQAFRIGRADAGKTLNRNFNPAANGSGNSLGGMAWPADGIANYAVLENLAASDQIGTVILDSSTMPPVSQPDYTPSAQTSTPDGEGPELKVLLSDDTITQILGSANSPTDSKATAFAVAQRYLAETAMIAAEQPSLARSIVVAPPRDWNPPAGLASELLGETVRAPWLKPVSLSQLAAAKHPSGQVSRQNPAKTSPAELSRTQLDQVRQLEQQVKLLQSIQIGQGPALYTGVAAAESSAWRGSGSQQGATLVQQLSQYVSGQESEVKIIRPPRVTLAGLTGPVPVTISNGLDYPVKVRLQVGPSSGISVKSQPPTMIIQPGQQQSKKVEITASNVGSTTLTLRLLTPQGAPFPAQTTVIIQATHYGTLALVIIGAALGVFVLTSATRAFRRGRRALQDKSSDPDAGDGTPSRHQDQGEADTVVAETPATGHTTASDHTAEETDDYAWAPGRADPR